MLILASQSPRRREILERAGLRFSVRAADVDESVRPGEIPMQYVRRLACLKAVTVEREEADVVLGADTTVVVDGQILGKPQDQADAARMLRLLSGREHEVITGICLRHGASLRIDSETTLVRFVPLSDEQIESYVATGEPSDKAGAYAIQGIASRYIDRIEGCYFNVVGLPMALLFKHLNKIDRKAWS
jgi:septum formation protein